MDTDTRSTCGCNGFSGRSNVFCCVYQTYPKYNSQKKSNTEDTKKRTKGEHNNE